ncbi:MAG: hypothetical protein ACOYB8_10265 [Eubacteriaceae bacterium]
MSSRNIFKNQIPVRLKFEKTEERDLFYFCQSEGIRVSVTLNYLMRKFRNDITLMLREEPDVSGFGSTQELVDGEWIVAKIDPNDISFLTEYCSERKISKSSIMQFLVKEFLEKGHIRDHDGIYVVENFINMHTTVLHDESSDIFYLTGSQTLPNDTDLGSVLQIKDGEIKLLEEETQKYLENCLYLKEKLYKKQFGEYSNQSSIFMFNRN